MLGCFICQELYGVKWLFLFGLNGAAKTNVFANRTSHQIDQISLAADKAK